MVLTVSVLYSSLLLLTDTRRWDYCAGSEYTWCTFSQVSVREEGVRSLAKGWAPTCIGYSMQGICKFGFYEVFKILYGNMIGEENSYLYRTSLYLAASASAEFFADIALSPMEAIKVRPVPLMKVVNLLYYGSGRPLPWTNQPWPELDGNSPSKLVSIMVPMSRCIQ